MVVLVAGPCTHAPKELPEDLLKLVFLVEPLPVVLPLGAELGSPVFLGAIPVIGRPLFFVSEHCVGIADFIEHFL